MIEISAQMFETIMLICFGSSWPFAVTKTIRTKTVQGKSIAFLLMVITGYFFGILHKLIGNLDWVILLYCINSSLVMTEIVLYMRYKSSRRPSIKKASIHPPRVDPERNTTCIDFEKHRHRKSIENASPCARVTTMESQASAI